jgi:hypothetical protein
VLAGYNHGPFVQVDDRNATTYNTGLLVNYGGTYSIGATSIVTDGIDATTVFSVGDKVYKADGTLLGILTGITGSGTARTLVIGAGTLAALTDNNPLYAASGWKGMGEVALNASNIAVTAQKAGILERHTQAAAMLGNDQLGRQVRYNEGRRLTRPFGCPVRTVRNASTVRKKFPGDDAGKDINELALAHQYYLIDWWGNTRGEDVRRMPARGFGIRPAWDPEDAYLDGGYALRPSNQTGLFRRNHTTTYNTGVLVDNGGGYSAGTAAAMTVGTVDATLHFAIGDEVYKADGTLVGILTAVGSGTSIRIQTTIGTAATAVGTLVSLADTDPLYAVSWRSGQDGSYNATNSAVWDEVDWYNPKRAQRVGDRGDGRGVRWPTVFNESKLHDISRPVSMTGVVVSHSTAEPPFTPGYIRPSNDAPTSTEIPHGISDRLGVAQDGLLQPEANVGSNIDNVSGTFTSGEEVLADPITRDAPRIGLDADTVDELSGGIHTDYVGISTQASSLHTDREVGQRVSLSGAYEAGSAAIGNLDLTSLYWSGHPNNGVVRFSNAHAFWSLGGTYVMEVRNFVKPFDDSNWGRIDTDNSNPYADANHDPTASSGTQRNLSDLKVRFLFRPTRVLDNRNVEMFRAAPVLTVGPQRGTAVNTGVLINNGGGYSAGTTAAMVVDTVDATLYFAVGDTVANSSGSIVGVITAVADATHITIGGGTKVAVSDSEALYRGKNVNDAYRSTGGGKYGLFNYDTPSGRTVPPGIGAGTVSPTNGPYSSVYTVYTLKNTGVKINNGGGYAAGTTAAMTVDTVDATTQIAVGDRIFLSTGALIGTISAVGSSTSIRVVTGTLVIVADNALVYIEAPAEAVSKGPNIPGSEASDFSSSIDQTTARVVISENTLEHFRSDASRRRAYREGESILTRKDYAVQPRHSQTLHPKGEGGTTSFNTGDHSTE